MKTKHWRSGHYEGLISETSVLGLRFQRNTDAAFNDMHIKYLPIHCRAIVTKTQSICSVVQRKSKEMLMDNSWISWLWSPLSLSFWSRSKRVATTKAKLITKTDAFSNSWYEDCSSIMLVLFTRFFLQFTLKVKENPTTLKYFKPYFLYFL